MSKHLGLSYITDEIKTYYQNRLDKPYITDRGGIRLSLPRYYRNKLGLQFDCNAEIVDAWDSYLRTHPNVNVKKLVADFNMSIDICENRRLVKSKCKKF